MEVTVCQARLAGKAMMRALLPAPAAGKRTAARRIVSGEPEQYPVLWSQPGSSYAMVALADVLPIC